MQVLSLFSGLGGLDLGFRIAGLEIVAVADIDELALSHSSKALGATPIVCDLSREDPHDVIDAANLTRSSDLLLIAGPPCTGFSHAGFWLDEKRNGKDSQIHRIGDFVRYVKALRPRAFIMENVPGILFKNFRKVLNSFLSETYNAGYNVVYKKINSADYGVPQSRHRVFFVGISGAESFEFPSQVFEDKFHRSSSWAIGTLSKEQNPPESDEKLNGKYSHLLPKIPPGDNYLYFTENRGYSDPIFKWRSRYWSFLQKLDPHKPSPTLPAQRISNNGPFHWNNRHLRLREIARLQGFPDNYPLPKLRQARQQLGNAVPPILAAHIAFSLVEILMNVPIESRNEKLRASSSESATVSDVNTEIASHVLCS